MEDSGLDIDLNLINAFLDIWTVGMFVTDPLNNLFNGNNASYLEEIFVDTTVDGILYSVSYFRF